jgi:AraC-like DNA-binding protein
MIWLDEGGRGRDLARLIPAGSLGASVEHFCIQVGPVSDTHGRSWRVVADFCPHIIFTLDSAPGQNQRARCSLIGSRRVYRDADMRNRQITLGARLRIGTLQHLTRSSAAIFNDRAVDVEDFFGAAGRQLVDRIGDSTPEAAINHLREFLRARLPTVRSNDRFGRALRHAKSVSSLASALNISERAVHSRSVAATGLNPNCLLRLTRLHKALHIANTTKWIDVAYLAGYADQAHLVREFRRFLGEPPSKWQSRQSSDLFNTERDRVS